MDVRQRGMRIVFCIIAGIITFSLIALTIAIVRVADIDRNWTEWRWIGAAPINQFGNAIQSDDAATVKRIIDDRPWMRDGFMPDADGQLTPLHVAASAGAVQVTELLLNEGADVDAQITDSGYTPLHWAANSGYTEVVELLIRGGADVHLKTRDGKTALQLAQQIKHEDIIEMLRHAETRQP